MDFFEGLGFIILILLATFGIYKCGESDGSQEVCKTICASRMPDATVGKVVYDKNIKDCKCYILSK